MAAGLPILVMCVTGTLLTYQIQLQAWIDHLAIQSRPALPGAQALTLEDLIAITHKNRGADPITISVFREAAAPVEVELNRAAEPLYLDAYTGSVIGGPSKKAREFFGVVTAWHLGLSPRGPHWPQFRVVERAVNLVALITAILGILIWLPRRWTWSHCAIADHHLLVRPAPATPPSFGTESQAEGFGGLDGGNVGSGVLVAQGPTLRIGPGLGEKTTQLYFACVRWLAVHLARAALCRGLRHRNTSAIHLDIEERHGGAAACGHPPEQSRPVDARAPQHAEEIK